VFRITGEHFSLAFRLLSKAFGLQVFGAGGFTGCFLDFSRGLSGDARKLYLWCYPLSISSRLCLSRLTTRKRFRRI
jgi:hypothetical protein